MGNHLKETRDKQSLYYISGHSVHKCIMLQSCAHVWHWLTRKH